MKKITGTQQAFEKMIAQRGIYAKLGVERSTVANWKRYLAEGQTVSLDKMEEMLLKYGAEVAHEKVWKLPDTK